MAKTKSLTPSADSTPGAEVKIRMTRRTDWKPSVRLPDYILEDDLNKLMDPREWKTYRALWRHSIGLRRTPIITAGYADISDMTGLSRASVIRSLKGLMKNRYVVRILGEGGTEKSREKKAPLPTQPREGHRYLVCNYREILEGRLKDGTLLMHIPEGGLFAEEVEVLQKKDGQPPLFSG